MCRYIEIGSLREHVEIIEAPTPDPRGRVGRIRHANGENVAIDHATLSRLIKRARRASDSGEDSVRQVSADNAVLRA